MLISQIRDLWLTAYSESKLDLEFNLNKILPVYCKFICDSILSLFDKTPTSVSEILALSAKMKPKYTEKTILQRSRLF